MTSARCSTRRLFSLLKLSGRPMIGASSWMALVLYLSSAGIVVAQDRRVELEVVAEARATPGTQQRWMQMLQEVGADRVVIKTGNMETPTVEEFKLGSSVTLTVTGYLKGSKLALPGGSFGITDKTRIRDLLQQLRDDGAKVALADKKAFGLTSEQLVAVHSRLSEAVEFETKNRPASDVVSRIGQQTGLRWKMDAAARTALAGKDPVAEELKGISSGTALAIVLRPLGLVFHPQRLQGGTTEFLIVDSQNADEHWPVGWPIQKPPVQVEPKLFEQLELEIRGFPLADVLKAIQTRTGVPMIYDHNSMARHGVDLHATKVTLVRKQVSFSVALAKLLNQSKPALIDELRVDESGKPFLWISVLR